MNKTLKTMVIAGLACVALFGTTMAAPAKNGGKPPAPAKQQQQIKAPGKAAPKQQAKNPSKHNQQAKAPVTAAPKHQETKRHDARPHEEPRHEIVRNKPAHRVETVKAPPPARTVIVEEHHDTNPIVALGCALVGGIVGAIAG